MTDTSVHPTTETAPDAWDEEWLAAPAERRSRLRLGLVVALAAAVCFLGGALTQKHLGAQASTGAVAGPGAGRVPEGLPAGFGEGGFPGAGRGTDTGTGAGTIDGTDGADGAGEDAEEAVIGVLVEVRDGVWVVEDLGGTRHEVAVSDDTEITRESRVDAADVEVGDSVDVRGQQDDGGLTADEVTLR